jgi:hypothetical protein
LLGWVVNPARVLYRPEEHRMTSRTRVLHGASEPQPDAERRGKCRNLSHRTVNCRSITGPPNVTWHAAVWDASAGGIGLITPVPFEPGTVLAVNLSPGEDQTPLTKLVVVRHVRAEAEQRWLVGGFFVHPLSRQQMDALG